jgi:purine-binding chemotaxis protein CheW
MSETKRAVARTAAQGGGSQHVTVEIGQQLFGIPVLLVHDVLGPQRITRIPLAPPEIAGSLNLRGRIVTAVDVRMRLGLPARDGGLGTEMSVVVEHQGESYSLMVDQVGEVLALDDGAFEQSPPSLDPRWRAVSRGIYRLEDRLLVALDVERLLDFKRDAAA